MRKLQWQKIPINNIVNKNNLWTTLGKRFRDYPVDYHRMDELFAVDLGAGHDASGKRPGGGPEAVDGSPDTKRKKENVEVSVKDFFF
jgi:hypothetical protein